MRSIIGGGRRHRQSVIHSLPMRTTVDLPDGLHRLAQAIARAQLARSRGGRLATFDRGLAQLHSDVADLLPTD